MPFFVPAKITAERRGYCRIMGSGDIEQLHQQCVEALKDLIRQADRTCSLLQSMTEFPITLDSWNNALDHRVRENQAHARYQEARERLFRALRPR
jgi:hypothetical protein